MKVLTDTHTLVWALSYPEKLSADARTALAESEFTASVVNLWELILKTRNAGALVEHPLPWWDKYVIQQRIPALPIRTTHLRALARLEDFHRDPFDRILVAQALAEGMTLITKDAMLTRYGVPIIW